MLSRMGLLKEALRPLVSKVVVGISFVASVWNWLTDQFGMPRIPAVWNMTLANVEPIYWLALSAGGILYGLFEYVRNNVGPTPNSPALPPALSEDGVIELIARHAPRSPPPPPATDKVGEVERKMLGIVDDQIAPAIAENKKAIEELLAELAPILAAEKRRFVDQLVRFIEDRRYPMLKISDNWSGRKPHERGLGSGDRIIADFRKLGITDEERRKAHLDARQAIMGDAKYLILAEGEDAYWQDGEAKRRWHLGNADCDGDIALLREKRLI